MGALILIAVIVALFFWINREPDNAPPPPSEPKPYQPNGGVASNPPRGGDGKMSVIRRALDSQSNLAFTYVDQQGEMTERTALPLSLERRHENQIWCLNAYCHLRAENRTFVVSRMEGVRIV